MQYRTGKTRKNDNTVVNIADMMESISKKLINETKPRLLATIDFSEFTAGGTVSRYFMKELNRNAKRRAIILYNTTDVIPSQQRVTMNDTFLYETTRTAGSTATTNQTVANRKCIQVIDGNPKSLSGDMGEMINAPVDSFGFSFTIGTTAPTTGEIKIAIVEVLH